MFKPCQGIYNSSLKPTDFLQTLCIRKIPFTVGNAVKVGNYPQDMSCTSIIQDFVKAVTGTVSYDTRHWDLRAVCFKRSQGLYLEVRNIRIFVRAGDFYHKVLAIFRRKSKILITFTGKGRPLSFQFVFIRYFFLKRHHSKSWWIKTHFTC